MIWDDVVLEDVQNRLNNNSTYWEESVRLSYEMGERILSEQLRGALRRWRKRTGYNQLDVPAIRAAEMPPAVIPAVLRQPEPVDFQIVNETTFGALGDTHLCSNYSRLDILESLYDIYHQRGISTVYHTGNYIDGEAPFNVNDIHVRGIDGQCLYFVQNYPRRDGITTKYIDGGDHEGWWTQKHGIITGQHIEDMARRAGRNDLIYLGYMEADVRLLDLPPDVDSPIMRVMHPGGGSSYALSHTSQKLIDSYEDYEKPDVLLMGHYHKASLLPNYRGVLVVQTGCTQEPTPFMRKKRLHADLGGWIITIGTNRQNKVAKVSAEFISFPMNPWRHR